MLVGTSSSPSAAVATQSASSHDLAGGNGAWTGRHAPGALDATAAQGTVVYAPRDGGHVVAGHSDGIAWTDYAAGTADLEGIASSGTMLVAVGKAGAMEYSANGTSWTAASSGRRVRPVVRHVCEWSVRRNRLRRHDDRC